MNIPSNTVSNSTTLVCNNFNVSEWSPRMQEHTEGATDKEPFKEDTDYAVSTLFSNKLPPSINFIPPTVFERLSSILSTESMNIMNYFKEKITTNNSESYNKHQKGLQALKDALNKDRKERLSEPLLEDFSPFEQMLVLLEYKEKNISEIVSKSIKEGNKNSENKPSIELFSFFVESKRHITIIFTVYQNSTLLHFKLQRNDIANPSYGFFENQKRKYIDDNSDFIESLTALEFIRQPWLLFNVLYKTALYINKELDPNNRFATNSEFTSVEAKNQMGLTSFPQKIEKTGEVLSESSYNNYYVMKPPSCKKQAKISYKETLDTKEFEAQKKMRRESSFYSLFQGVIKQQKMVKTIGIGRECPYYTKKLGLDIRTTTNKIFEALKKEHNEQDRPQLRGHLFRLFCTTMGPLKNEAFYDDILEKITPSFEDTLQKKIIKITTGFSNLQQLINNEQNKKNEISKLEIEISKLEEKKNVEQKEVISLKNKKDEQEKEIEELRDSMQEKSIPDRDMDKN